LAISVTPQQSPDRYAALDSKLRTRIRFFGPLPENEHRPGAVPEAVRGAPECVFLYLRSWVCNTTDRGDCRADIACPQPCCPDRAHIGIPLHIRDLSSNLSVHFVDEGERVRRPFARHLVGLPRRRCKGRWILARLTGTQPLRPRRGCLPACR